MPVEDDLDELVVEEVPVEPPPPPTRPFEPSPKLAQKPNPCFYAWEDARNKALAAGRKRTPILQAPSSSTSSRVVAKS